MADNAEVADAALAAIHNGAAMADIKTEVALREVAAREDMATPRILAGLRTAVEAFGAVRDPMKVRRGAVDFKMPQDPAATTPKMADQREAVLARTLPWRGSADLAARTERLAATTHVAMAILKTVARRWSLAETPRTVMADQVAAPSLPTVALQTITEILTTDTARTDPTEVLKAVIAPIISAAIPKDATARRTVAMPAVAAMARISAMATRAHTVTVADEIRMGTIPTTPHTRPAAGTAVHRIIPIIIATIIVAGTVIMAGTVITSAMRIITGITVGITDTGTDIGLTPGSIVLGAGIGAAGGARAGGSTSAQSASASRSVHRGHGDITTIGIRTGLLRRFAA